MHCLRDLSPLILIAAAYLGAVATAQAAEPLAQPLTTPNAQASYGIGVQVGRNFLQGGLDGDLIDIAALMAGIQDALEKKEPRVSQDQFKAAMEQVQKIAQQRLERKMQVVGEKTPPRWSCVSQEVSSPAGSQDTDRRRAVQSCETGNRADSQEN